MIFDSYAISIIIFQSFEFTRNNITHGVHNFRGGNAWGMKS